MVHDNVARVRAAKGVTKSYMAHKLNMSAMGYGHLEFGNVRLDVERLKVIGKILNVDPSVFFNDSLTDSVINEINSVSCEVN